MIIRLSPTELEIYNEAAERTINYVNDWVLNQLYDEVYDIIADYDFKRESDIPPGSRSVDAAVDRIYHNLRENFEL